MIICVCHRVSDRDIARAVREGCESFDELQFETGVATACGCCHDCARETFEQHCAGAASPSSALGALMPVTLHRTLNRGTPALAVA